MKTPLQYFAGLSLAFTISLLNPSAAIAQTQKPEKRDIYTFVEHMPLFEGGEAGMMQYIGQNLRYAEGLPGGLLVASFVVNPDSSVSDVAILKGLHPELEKESVRVIESMSGKWVPGRQNGKLVAVRFTLPIRFEGSEPKSPAKTNTAHQVNSTGQFSNSSMREGDVMPDYKEGIAELYKFIDKNKINKSLKSPWGISQISFIVHEDDSLSDFRVVKSLSPALDQEAIRVLTLTSGDWNPGMQLGKPVKVRFTVPVRF